MERAIPEDGRVHGVIVACPREDGRWLLIRRSHREQFGPLAICFPGGKAEPGESARDTAVREMREELGIGVEALRLIWRHAIPESNLMLWGVVARLESTAFVLEPAEVEEALWMTLDEAAKHPEALPSTVPFVEALRSHPLHST
jgi:8-oxo-dGTP pyrophosphatase MutT (NUDIX family)